RHCLSVFSWWCAASRPLRSFPTRRSSDLLSELVRHRKIDRVLLALPSASRRRRREILTQLEPLGVHVQSLPNLSDLISGKAQINELRDVDVGDLLGRDPVPPNPKLFGSSISGKCV